MTVTGATLAENLAAMDIAEPDGVIVHPPSDPIHPWGGLAILRGNLAPDGAVVKAAGAEGLVFEGTAKPFDSEQEAFDALTRGAIVAGDVMVIRYEGPKGSPGMPEMLAVTAARRRRRPGQGGRAHHRRPVQRGHEGVQRGPHRARGVRGRADRARARGRPRSGIDADARSIELLVDDAELEPRRVEWKQPEPGTRRGRSRSTRAPWAAPTTGR